MKLLTFAAGAVLTVACHSYNPPALTPQAQQFGFYVLSSPAAVVDAASRELNALGFRITSVARAEGRLSAEGAIDVRPGLYQCRTASDSSRAIGRSMIVDVGTGQVGERTTARVGAHILVQRDTLACSSTGVIEQRVASAIRSS